MSLVLVIGWILTIFLGVLGAVLLYLMVTGKIELQYLIADENGDASLSRFQFLVFTFVIAMSMFYLIASKTPPGYPEIPNQILALLGISGGSYVVAKGIQSSRDVDMKTNTPAPSGPPGSPAPQGAPGPQGAPATLGAPVAPVAPAAAGAPADAGAPVAAAAPAVEDNHK